MKKLHKERDLLKDALRDLDTELEKMESSKHELEKKVRSDSEKLDFVKGQEIRLRNLISLSIQKEDSLQKKKNKLKDKLAEVNKKIEKVKAVERELKDV